MLDNGHNDCIGYVLRVRGKASSLGLQGSSAEVKMETAKIYGYLFCIKVDKGEAGYVAYAPGVGGVYEEGQTADEAVANAYESASAIIEARFKLNNPIVSDSEDLKVLKAPPSRRYIAGMPEGYIVTPHYRTPVPA